ncbi:MAG: DUF6880 family protein [Elusimicrobiota bacterium]
MRDPRLERRIEAALCPGEFISAQDSFDLVEALESVRNSIAALLPREAKRAAALCETFLAGCSAKADEVDDSHGNFGDFAQSLICDWVRARRADGRDAAQTVQTLLRWKAKDEHSFFCRIERQLAETFNRVERAAFIGAIRARFDEELKKAGGTGGPRPHYDAPYPLREATDMLKTIYEAAKDAAAYVDLCHVMGVSPKDCERIAKILQSRGKLGQALEWGEKGLHLESQQKWPNQDASGLGGVKRELLKGLGRHQEALQQTWEEFRSHPGEYSYVDLMGCVPAADRTTWHEKAMEAAETASLGSCVELYMKARELNRLAARVSRSKDEELRGIYYSRAIDAAKKLAKEHPAEAAALYRGQAIHILDSKKSELYRSAVKYFSEARRCYEAAGQGEKWRGLVKSVLQEHSRKQSFLAKFQPLASGEKPVREPSFLTRAKRRWNSGE